MKTKIAQIFIFLLSILYLISCVDKEFDLNRLSTEIEYNPKLAITIGTVSIELGDLLSDYTLPEYLKDNPDGSMLFIYEKDLPSFRAEQKINVPDQLPIVIPALAFPATIPASGEAIAQTTIDVPIVFSNNEKIDSMLVKSLSLSLTGTSSYNSAFSQELSLTFENMNKDTVISSTPQRISYVETVPISSIVNYITPNKYNAYRYMLTFTSVSPGNSTTKLKVVFKLRGTPGTPINPASSLNLVLKVEELKYRIMYGYIGQLDLLNITDTIDLSILGRELSKNIEWYKPQLKIEIKNSYKVPADFLIQSLFVTTYNNQLIDVSPNNALTEGNNPKYPIKRPAVLGQWAYDSVLCEKQKGYNSFYHALETQSPTNLIYTVISHANPYGEPTNSTDYNILTDTSMVTGKMIFSLPIWLRSPGFGFTDTMDFDLSNMNNNNDDNNNDDEENNTKVTLNSMLFRIISYNQMPIDMELQVYFVDENYNILDSLYKTGDKYILRSGNIDEATGKVLTPKLWKKDAIFDQSQLKRIENTKKIIYNVKYISADYENTKPYVKFFKDSKLKLTFAAQFQPNIHIYDNNE